MNVRSAPAGRLTCAVCASPVKRDETSKLCTNCANLTHVDCVPYTTLAELCFQCPKCKLSELARSQFPSDLAVKSASLPAASELLLSSECQSASSAASLQFPIPSTPPPFASATIGTSSAGVSSTPKRVASPPSPTTARDAKQHCPSSSLSESGDSLSSVESQIDMGSKANGSTGQDAASAYFTKFIENFNERMDNVDSKINALDSSVTARIAQIESRVDTVQNAVEHLTNRSILVDNAEILVSGLPRNTQLSHAEIATKLLNSLGVPHFTQHIINLRVWNGPDLVPLQNIPNMQPQANSANRTSNPNFFALVMKMNPTVVRDELISRTPVLKEKTIATILNVPGDSSIFCRALWPREVYQLYKKALLVSKNLNYERPVVKNLIVCMRETRTSRLIPLSSELELNFLPRRSVPPN
ncbi:hypothetical protein QAD02_003290 [Eretmocerus hayati]|uniref:Uncharacterized protein n=1 Tax=Eretmocerus hayati TaxID=131215 RepID=A0ACC2NMA5_9HYME|nr:hypothetical protein QAD02_003290 [Eretmocerus hayati]